MEIIFLGTSAGKPTLERNVSALAIRVEQDSSWSLFDCGEATQHQVMKSSLSIGKIDKIFITHLHGDHFFGLCGLLSTRKMEEISSPLHIFAPKGVKEFLKTVSEISQMDLTNIEITEIREGDEYFFNSFDMDVVKLSHSIESYAFVIKEHPKAPKLKEDGLKKIGVYPSPVYGELKKGKRVVLEDGRVIDGKDFLLEPQKGRVVIVAGDNDDPSLLCRYLQKADLLIHEATYTQEIFDSLKKKQKHTTAKSLALIASRCKVKNLIATHISARYTLEKRKNSRSVSEIEDEIRRYFKGVFFVAKDFDKYYLSQDGKLSKFEN